MLTQLTIFLYIVIFLYGIVIGSFLNVLIFRIPKKENIVQSSHCMNCGRKLGWRDMVPVFSYMILRGRCRQCGARISIQYPLIGGFSHDSMKFKKQNEGLHDNLTYYY